MVDKKEFKKKVTINDASLLDINCLTGKRKTDPLICDYEKKTDFVYFSGCGEKIIALPVKAKYCTFCGKWIRKKI